MINNDFEEQTTGSESFVGLFGALHRKQIEANVYFALQQGLRAGVRPDRNPPAPDAANYPPNKRVVFIEFPQKTLEWRLGETDVNTPWFDSFPQYDQ